MFLIPSYPLTPSSSPRIILGVTHRVRLHDVDIALAMKNLIRAIPTMVNSTRFHWLVNGEQPTYEALFSLGNDNSALEDLLPEFKNLGTFIYTTVFYLHNFMRHLTNLIFDIGVLPSQTAQIYPKFLDGTRATELASWLLNLLGDCTELEDLHIVPKSTRQSGRRLPLGEIFRRMRWPRLKWLS